jgi:hypothetical protein
MIARRGPCNRKLAILLLLSAAPAWDGFCSSNLSSEPRHDFQFFAGYSPVSTTLIGTATGRRFFLAGFGYSYRCRVWPGVSISYSGELLPAAVLLQPGQYLPQYGGGIRIKTGRVARHQPGLQVSPYLQRIYQRGQSRRGQ